MRIQELTRLWLCLPGILVVACAPESAPAPASRSRGADVRSSEQDSEDDQGGVEVVDASTARRVKAVDAGQERAEIADAGARDAGKKEEEPPRERDAGLRDAGLRDAGEEDASPPEPPPEPANSGSCCSPSRGRGCGDQALQECVCALSPRCCSDAWDESCVRLVKEKNCQPGVRDCVCGSAEGQWQQAYCCEGGWNSTCESVSIHKCGASEEACP